MTLTDGNGDICLCMSCVVEHRFPFSLFSNAKGSGSVVTDAGCTVEKCGHVSNEMDKTIGRPVVKITGAVSANNYIDYNNLNLTGQYIYIQLCLLKANIATLHMEVVTSRDVTLRITMSTLYDQPRFLGRSLRLPLPISSRWTVLALDMNYILNTHCPVKNTVLTMKQFKVPISLSIVY